MSSQKNSESTDKIKRCSVHYIRRLIKDNLYYVKLSFGVIVLTSVYMRLNTPQLKESFRSLNYVALLLAVTTALLQHLSNSLILFSLQLSLKVKTRFSSMVSLSMKKAVYSFALPSTVGGDVYFTAKFGKEWKDYYRSATALLVIRSLGFANFLFLLALSLVLSQYRIVSELAGLSQPSAGLSGHRISFMSVGVIVLLAVCILVITKYYAKAKTILGKSIRTIKTIACSGVSFFMMVGFTMLWGIVSLSGRLAFAVLIGIDIDLLSLSSIILLVNLLMMVPVSISGVGIREMGYIGLVSLFGVSAEHGLLLAMFDFSVLLTSVSLGYVYMLAIHLKQLYKTVSTGNQRRQRDEK